MEIAGVWPANASTTFLLLIPTSTTSARPIALLPTLIRWWEWLRASAVVEWNERHTVTGDACSEYVGGCGKDGRRCWNWKQWTLRAERRQNGKGATALVVDLAKAFEKVQRGAVWTWAMFFDFPQRALRVLCVCVRSQDLLTKPITRQRLDRLRPPLGLVMKTRGNDDENSALDSGEETEQNLMRSTPTILCTT